VKGGWAARNSTVETCPRGHPYDYANTYSRPGRNWRECRACKLEWAWRNRANKRKGREEQ
jgi:hypothetical protein